MGTNLSRLQPKSSLVYRPYTSKSEPGWPRKPCIPPINTGCFAERFIVHGCSQRKRPAAPLFRCGRYFSRHLDVDEPRVGRWDRPGGITSGGVNLHSGRPRRCEKENQQGEQGEQKSIDRASGKKNRTELLGLPGRVHRCIYVTVVSGWQPGARCSLPRNLGLQLVLRSPQPLLSNPGVTAGSKR